ncbi:MAG: CDP-alcohol phosphatidyltransferase family protein [bacterium]|nr:CDP-alcohol phosphatidyltransferase family protein [bacterium]MBU1917474.1 CDP-alcohol phosphatidyltransferase family protein [bacterium]
MTKPTTNQVSVFNLATYLTISRFFLVPVFIYFFLIAEFTTALIILVIASITDVTDGLLARKFNMGTKVGSVLDPLADKFLMLISFLVLSAKGVFPWWLAAVVIGRDFYIVFGMMHLYFIKKLNIKVKPTILSKRTTFAQFLLLALSFFKVYLIHRPDIFTAIYRNLVFNFQWIMIWVTLILTLITFVQYTLIALEFIKNDEQREPEMI